MRRIWRSTNRKVTTLWKVSIPWWIKLNLNVDGSKSNEKTEEKKASKTKKEKPASNKDAEKGAKAAKDDDYEPEDGLKAGKSKRGRKSKQRSPSKDSARKSPRLSGRKSKVADDSD